jgi:soluble lytic murein transglycosylase-like protein
MKIKIYLSVIVLFGTLIFSYCPVVAVAESDTIHLYGKTSQNGSDKKQAGFTYDTRFDKFIEKYADSHSIDSYLIKCIIKVESDFNPDAVSVAGAAGLMQLMQYTAWEYNVTDRSDPESNIRAGVSHFSFLMKEFKGDVPLALAAYHAGYNRVKKLGAVPPIRSTIDYVNQVMKYYSGGGDYSASVKKLYMKVDKEGTVHISDR